MSDMNLAKDLMASEGFSFVIAKNNTIIEKSNVKGIKPIVSLLENQKGKVLGASIADKIVGKAVALLAIYGGVEEVYAQTISDCAKTIMQKHDVKVNYNRIVPYIMNQTGTDKCPMEKLVENIESPEEAYKEVITHFRKRETSVTNK
ncbi:DUF1893 domain-containing protein [Serpentinicella sp. ANB-PHB4]|uniref:DUF1893 domain-containing protein n=1 Tax=Serpentinicella sp. ANB-PHB4 TaxID=3074076 RepID=UPI002866A375|nr:DUF1893 domain-containing protein [Serpentinicella sp. ANB-PHB4]MDR5658746.1 DUF1893 domain-containing protein [Serpentinicella sp. ANB-PHB4]